MKSYELYVNEFYTMWGESSNTRESFNTLDEAQAQFDLYCEDYKESSDEIQMILIHNGIVLKEFKNY